jgi:hypothetical protein
MRLLLLVLIAGCGGQHIVGAVEPCCVSAAQGHTVPICDASEPSSICVCIPELCGAGPACSTSTDCKAPVLPILKCANGVMPAATVDCVDRHCRMKDPNCSVPQPKQTCSRDAECEQVSGCLTCADGSRVCHVVRCTDGACHDVPPSCGCRRDSDCGDIKACSPCADGTTQRCLRLICVVGQCLVVPGPECATARGDATAR